MSKYLAHRVAELAAVLFLASILVFLFLRAIPGDPARIYAGEQAGPEAIAAIRERFGLDRPIPVQYVRWLYLAVQGDFGTSYVSGQPVYELISRAAMPTIELSVAALGFAVLVGLPAGILAALYRGRTIDYSVNVMNSLALSVPNFWLGLAGIIVLSLMLGWLPPGGRVPFTDAPLSAARALILPAFALGFRIAGILSRFSREALVDVLDSPYMRTARSKGVSSWRRLRVHGLRNAMIPVVTVFNIEVGRVLAGAVVIEAVFAWPGLGRLMLQAISNRDLLLVQALLLLFVGIFVAVNLITDVLYGILDPRVREQGQG